MKNGIYPLFINVRLFHRSNRLDSKRFENRSRQLIPIDSSEICEISGSVCTDRRAFREFEPLAVVHYGEYHCCAAPRVFTCNPFWSKPFNLKRASNTKGVIDFFELRRAFCRNLGFAQLNRSDFHCARRQWAAIWSRRAAPRNEIRMGSLHSAQLYHRGCHWSTKTIKNYHWLQNFFDFD